MWTGHRFVGLDERRGIEAAGEGQERAPPTHHFFLSPSRTTLSSASPASPAPPPASPGPPPAPASPWQSAPRALSPCSPPPARAAGARRRPHTVDGGAWEGAALSSGPADLVATAWLAPPSPCRWPLAPPGAGVDGRAGADEALSACVEHWAGAGALVLATVDTVGDIRLFWATPDGGWVAADAVRAAHGDDNDDGTDTHPPPPPITHADVAAADGDGVHVLTVRGSVWPALVTRIDGDPTARGDDGTALDPPVATPLAALACGRGASALGAAFLPDAAGDGVLLLSGDGSNSTVTLSRWDAPPLRGDGGGCAARCGGRGSGTAEWALGASWTLSAGLQLGPALPPTILAVSYEGDALVRVGGRGAVAVAVADTPSTRVRAPPPPLPTPGVLGAAFGPTGCAVALTAVAGTVSVVRTAAAKGDDDKNDTSLAGRLTWAAATGRSPLDAALALGAASPSTRSTALAELAADVADQPWATRPAVWPPAARGALAVCRAARAAAAAAAPGTLPDPHSPEAALEDDLLTCLRAADVEAAARAAIAPPSARGAAADAARAADAVALAPAAAWAEAATVRLLLAGRAWASARAAGVSGADATPGARPLASSRAARLPAPRPRSRGGGCVWPGRPTPRRRPGRRGRRVRGVAGEWAPRGPRARVGGRPGRRHAGCRAPTPLCGRGGRHASPDG